MAFSPLITIEHISGIMQQNAAEKHRVFLKYLDGIVAAILENACTTPVGIPNNVVVRVLNPKPDTICAEKVFSPPLGTFMQMKNSVITQDFQSKRASRT